METRTHSKRVEFFVLLDRSPPARDSDWSWEFCISGSEGIEGLVVQFHSFIHFFAFGRTYRTWELASWPFKLPKKWPFKFPKGICGKLVFAKLSTTLKRVVNYVTVHNLQILQRGRANFEYENEKVREHVLVCSYITRWKVLCRKTRHCPLKSLK